MDSNLLIPLATSAIVLWAVYRRLRRTFGRQPVQPKRLYVRAVLLGAIGCLMLATSLTDWLLTTAIVAGLATGMLLGYYGLRHTRFEATEAGSFYTPHTYIGVVLTALFLGRFAFRFLKGYSDAHAAMQTSGNPLAAYQRSPLTLGLFGLLIGYYAYYNVGVVRRSRALADSSATGSPTASAST